MSGLHRRERTILEEGEIDDFRDRMGACRLNLSRPLAKSPTQRLLGTWARFLSSISFYIIVLGDNAPLDTRALLTPYSKIGLWILPLPFVCRGYSRRLHQKLLKGETAPDLAVHLRPVSYSGLRLSHILEITIYHVSPPGLSPIIRPLSIPYIPLDSNPQSL